MDFIHSGQSTDLNLRTIREVAITHLVRNIVEEQDTPELHLSLALASGLDTATVSNLIVLFDDWYGEDASCEVTGHAGGPNGVSGNEEAERRAETYEIALAKALDATSVFGPVVAGIVR